MDYYELQNKLRDEWKNARPQYDPFCDDGILSDEEIEKYWEKSSKIIFLLKETHNEFCNIRQGFGLGPTGSGPTFWRKMRIWTYIIDEVLNGNSPNYEEAMKIKETPNNSIAYMNLKKYAEVDKGKSSNDADILNYLKNDKDFLLKQIKLISPKIILCCGTFRYINNPNYKLFDNIIKIYDKLYKANNIYLIDFPHLSGRESYKKGYDELLKIASDLYTDITHN